MPTPRGPGGTSPDQLVNPRERWLYAAMVVVSLLVYGGLVLVGLSNPQAAASIFAYAIMYSKLGLFAHGLALVRIRGNAVRVSERQFPQLHRLAAAHARRLGLKRVPDMYVMESGGLLNAFATRFLGRDFVILYSDVLALALEQGEAAVSFIVGHELAHVWRGHLKHRWLTTPGRLFPYLGAAYSRACEYTCDRIGAFCQPDGAITGLLVLAAGWLGFFLLWLFGAILSLSFVGLTACGGDTADDTPEPDPEDTPEQEAAQDDEAETGPREVTRADFEDDGLTWPLTEDAAAVRCEADQRVILTVDGEDYPLNHEEAFDDDGEPAAAPVLQVDEETTAARDEADVTEEEIEEFGPVEDWPPVYVSTGDLVDAGLELCG
jgi:hypothetical protein